MGFLPDTSHYQCPGILPETRVSTWCENVQTSTTKTPSCQVPTSAYPYPKDINKLTWVSEYTDYNGKPIKGPIYYPTGGVVPLSSRKYRFCTTLTFPCLCTVSCTPRELKIIPARPGGDSECYSGRETAGVYRTSLFNVTAVESVSIYLDKTDLNTSRALRNAKAIARSTAIQKARDQALSYMDTCIGVAEQASADISLGCRRPCDITGPLKLTKNGVGGCQSESVEWDGRHDTYTAKVNNCQSACSAVKTCNLPPIPKSSG